MRYLLGFTLAVMSAPVFAESDYFMCRSSEVKIDFESKVISNPLSLGGETVSFRVHKRSGLITGALMMKNDWATKTRTNWEVGRKTGGNAFGYRVLSIFGSDHDFHPLYLRIDDISIYQGPPYPFVATKSDTLIVGSCY